MVNPNLTELVFIIDASGSMYSLKETIITSFNELIEEQKKLTSECHVTLVTFSDETKIIYDNENIQSINELTTSNYITDGYTALFDAIGTTIDTVGKRLSITQEDNRPGNVLVFIMTDGEDNKSKIFNFDKIKEMITLQTDTYNWKFTYTCATPTQKDVGISMGIPYSTAIPQTNKGYTGMMRDVTRSITNIRTSTVH